MCVDGMRFRITIKIEDNWTCDFLSLASFEPFFEGKSRRRKKRSRFRKEVKESSGKGKEKKNGETTEKIERF